MKCNNNKMDLTLFKKLQYWFDDIYIYMYICIIQKEMLSAWFYTLSCTISSLFELKKLVDFQINPTSCFHISKFKNNRPSYIMMSHILYKDKLNDSWALVLLSCQAREVSGHSSEKIVWIVRNIQLWKVACPGDVLFLLR